MEHLLFCDASFNPFDPKWETATEVRGLICITDGKEIKKTEEVGVGKVEGLKQYNNVLELTACARAIEIAIENGWTGELRINTDSRTATSWCFKGVPAKKLTPAHVNAEMYFREMRKRFVGEVFVGFVPREENPAGHILEAIVKKK